MNLSELVGAWIDDFDPADAARAGRARVEATRRGSLTPQEERTKARILARWRLAEQRVLSARLRRYTRERAS